MRENRGLSLVELLVTIAILAIVIAAATSFMITGSRSFAKGNADSELQKEAELAVNQIEDMIIDVNGGMNVTDDENKTEMVMYHGEIVGGNTVYTKEAVRWDKDGDKIYYGKWDVSYDESVGDYTENSTEYENQPLTEDVAAFEVEIDTENETALDGTVRTFVRSVQIRVGYENSSGGVDYATSPIITLRNRMMLSGNPTEIFEDFQASESSMKLWYSGTETLGIVPIIDYSSEVQRGGVYNIYARLTEGTGVNHLVNWEIETANTMSTIDSSGILNVGQSEANEYLTITAKYKNNPSKKASGIVKVVGGSTKSFEAITITTRSLEPFNPKFGSFPTFSDEGNWTLEEMATLTYKWTVSSPQLVESFVDSNDTLELRVKNEAASYDKVFDITLTAYCPVTNETRTDRIQYRVDSEGTVDGDSNMKRGMGVDGGHGYINYTFKTEYSTSYDYECYFCDIYGNKITTDNELYGDSLVFNLVSQYTAYYTLTFTENLPPDREFYVKVIVYFENEWTGNQWHYERIHYIPAVQLYDRHEYNDYGGANFDFYYGLVGYYDLSLANGDVVEYTIVEFDCESPAGVNVTANIVQTEARGEDRIYARGVISDGVNEGWLPSDIKPIRLKIKINLKGHPDICTYVTILFDR